MEIEDQKTIWTIGHSTRTAEEFLAILGSFQISILVDVRLYPGSRKYPHFNKENLASALNERKIRYVHLDGLGGRRKPIPDSKNTRWRHTAFRGYADHMETKEFGLAIGKLQELAKEGATVYMCSEAVWWSCHRSLISDYLKVRGWNVQHIMSEGKSKEHPYTSAARIADGELRYDDPTLF